MGKGESCSLEHNVALQGGQFSGTFEASFVMMTNQSLSWASWFQLVGAGWNPSYEIVPDFDKESKLNYNQHHCVRERVINERKEVRTVNLCTQQMNPLTNLFDAYLQVYDPVSTKSFAGANLTLAGFTLGNIKRIVSATINHQFSGVKK